MRASPSRVLPLASLIFLLLCRSVAPATAGTGGPNPGDAFHPPPRPPSPASVDPRPSPGQPSAFMAGRVAVRVIFVESDGAAEPSSEDWTSAQIAAIHGQIDAALAWWRDRVPNARLSFDPVYGVVESRYEPITHDLSTEGLWIGDVLARLGYTGASYFDQVYAADEALRRAHETDWATTIFVVNSAADDDGRFADRLFGYAYIGGPFMVVTSKAGALGMDQLAPIVAHELGHIFGALDQYAAAATPCTTRSGYLDVPTSNSQANDCGTNFGSIMLEPISAYQAAQVDGSALGQIGYRDENGDGLPDPLDTAPALQIALTQPPDGGRPVVTGSAVDQPHASSAENPTTINTIIRVEYRIDNGAWIALPPLDGAYDSSLEMIGSTIPLYDGQHNVGMRAINSIGAASPIIYQLVTVRGVGAAPLYQVNAPAFSNTPLISMALAAPPGSSMQIDDDPFFAGAAWSPVAASATWRLDPAEGTHTFFVRFRDANGLESPPIARSVLLDREPPAGRAIIRAGATTWLELHAGDSGSGVAAIQLGQDLHTPGDRQPFQPTVALPQGTNSVWVWFVDAAGNVSLPLLARTTYQQYLPLTQTR